jgi:hypothetical protein
MVQIQYLDAAPEMTGDVSTGAWTNLLWHEQFTPLGRPDINPMPGTAFAMAHDGDRSAYLNNDLWYRLFTNKYRGAIELTPYTGISTSVADEDASPMQMAANMGAVNAIQEMLLHTVHGTMRVFPAIPRFGSMPFHSKRCGPKAPSWSAPR